MKKWTYIGYVRAHSHDVRALTVAVPISREGIHDYVSASVSFPSIFPVENKHKQVFVLISKWIFVAAAPYLLLASNICSLS